MSAPGARSAPPGSWAPLLRLARRTLLPLERFLAIQAASGIVLLVVTATALVWANSPWAGSYVTLWETPLGLSVGPWAFQRPLAWWVNDGLMVIFFFVVGMEIRREMDHGELSDLRRAALPVACAVGGMTVPALCFLAVAGGGEATRSGWGVPMATDIAFAVGVLALLGKRVPPALRVLLLAVAVIDDLGAILVIALFYSSGIVLTGIVGMAVGIALILTLQALGVRGKLVYVVPGVVLWAGTYAAGIHPTIAGVIIGMLTPVTAWRGADGLLGDLSRELEALQANSARSLSSHDLAPHLSAIDVARREALSPAESLIETLHPWVAFAIMPIFALANAGVSLAGASMAGDGGLITLGAVLGLVLGKPLGILLFGGVAIASGLAALPTGLKGRHLLVLGVVAGIGFTMALFVADLAFTDAELLGAAKLGVLVASAAAALLGLLLGRFLLENATPAGAAATADEAEASTTE